MKFLLGNILPSIILWVNVRTENLLQPPEYPQATAFVERFTATIQALSSFVSHKFLRNTKVSATFSHSNSPTNGLLNTYVRTSQDIGAPGAVGTSIAEK